MMHVLVEPLLVAVLLLNFAIVGTSRVSGAINAGAMQGIVLGLLAIVVRGEFAFETVFIAAGAIALKGIIIPRKLSYAMREVVIKREIEPFIGYIPSLLLEALATALAILFARTLPLAPEQTGSLLVPAAISTVLTGFLVLTTRRKAITQVVGYLVLENGIFIMGLCFIEVMPLLVEIGVLLDLFVVVFILGIVIHHINREFASLDTTKLSALKE
jgi:hydrogenase-4 component E